LAPYKVTLLPPGGTLASRRLEFHLVHPPLGMTPRRDNGQLVGYGVTLVSLESDVFGRYSVSHQEHR
jgi:hypothetical protein